MGTLSRRHFIAGSARALIASAVGAELLASVGCGTSSTGETIPANRWAELARQLTGTLLRPGSAGFARYAAPNNLRYASVLPAGIALCANAQDVAASILWAREFGVPLIARSGGHSYGGYSTTTGLMIDVTAMRSVRYDAATGVVTLGGGARNEDVYRDLRPLERAITHGRCLSVGVAGLVLGGGVGFNMRSDGVTSDQLVETQMVTADGQIFTLNAMQHGDLFWACRGGGGGNFGINTSFSFQTFPVDRVTVYDLEWKQKPDEVFAALTNALESAPDAMGCKASVVAPTAAQRALGADITIQLLGQLRGGTPSDLAGILQPVYRIARPAGRIEALAYWPGQDFLSEPGTPEFFHETSRFFDEPIGSDVAAIVLDRMRRWPGTTQAASFKLFHSGGAMNAVPATATAFVHRSSLWLSSIGLVWGHDDTETEIQRGLAWQEDFYDAYVPFAKGGAYQNFIDPSLKGSKELYYGVNLPRLERIKARVDPHHVFRFAEAI